MGKRSQLPQQQQVQLLPYARGLERRSTQGLSISSLGVRRRLLRHPICFIPLLLLVLYTAFFVYIRRQTLASAIRPFWYPAPRPFRRIIPHYYAPGISVPGLCALHGWAPRPSPRRVFDAVIFNNELDLLEIRWRELLPVVSKFVLVESNSTFTGRAKPLWFSQNSVRFHFAMPHVVYNRFPGRALRPRESPFSLEYMQRLAVDQALEEAGIADGDLLIMADVDEIPSMHTIDLLRWCDGVPPVIHLQMTNYLYSFEFMVDKGSWRSSVHLYRPTVTEYDHGRQTDVILADAGWHCSFCFRYVKGIVFKMLAYSHADRVTSTDFLDHKRVQDIICRGADLFDMFPEAYSFWELISKLGPVPKSYTAVNLPSFLLRNHERFKFLLPGNCVRDFNSS